MFIINIHIMYKNHLKNLETMRVPTDFCVNEQKETIINILNDAIIFERIYKGMQETVKAANPTCEDWDPVSFYNGFANAWIFLTGYEFPEEVDEEIKDELSSIFFNHFEPDFKQPFEDRLPSTELAKHIFIDWEYTLDKKIYERLSTF